MNTLLKIFTVAAYVTMVAVNYLAVLLPLGGRGTGQISDNYPNLFAPAGYAFSIWGLIYTLLGIYVVYQLWQKKNSLFTRINSLFIINALLNVAWIFAWHYDLIWLSVILMAGLLVTLIKIADILRLSKLNKKEKWLVQLPFSIYFGWITVASIANVTVFLVSIGWNGFGLSPEIWTVLILLVGTLIGVLRMLRDRFIAYGLVFVWAYSAILAKHMSTSAFNGLYPIIIWAVVLCLVILWGTLIFLGIKKLKK